MKRLKIFILLILAGCATPEAGFNVEQLKTNEILGAGYEHLDGKLFSIFCGGNGYASFTFVKDSCMHNTAEFVYSKGYDYFTMLAMDGDIEKTQSGFVSNGVYIPYEITKQRQYYSIRLIKYNEIDKFKNFYKISDYYTPPLETEKQADSLGYIPPKRDEFKPIKKKD